MRLLPLFLLCSLLQNCRPAETYDKDITYIRAEDLTKDADFRFEDLIDSCIYIPLETSDEVLIGNVRQMEVTKNYILLSDFSNDALFVFDRRGKFLRTIGSRGRAPGEYQHLGTYCLTPAEDTVILYDEIGLKLLFYTIDNRFVRAIDLYPQLYRDSVSTRHIHSIYCPAEGQLLFAYHYMHRLPLVYSLYDYRQDSLRDIANMSFALRMPHPDVTVVVHRPIVTQYAGSFSCCIPFNDTVFQLTDNGLRPRFVVPALKDEMVSDDFARRQDGLEPSPAFKALSANGLFINTIDETEDYFFIGYSDRAKTRKIIWNKHAKKGILVSSPSSHAYSYRPHYLTMSELFDENNQSPQMHTPQLEQLRQQLKEDDNPVVVMYRLKKSR